MTIDSNADLEVVAKVVSPQMAASLQKTLSREGFEFMSELTLHMYATVWARPGLQARDRSLITLAMLIALRQTEELRPHAKLALTNGVTREEIEEIVAHASAYAGFPAALSAKAAISKALDPA
jgi:4-carboxymuconolactone decarboxylase